jgi:nitroreductase
MTRSLARALLPEWSRRRLGAWTARLHGGRERARFALRLARNCFHDFDRFRRFSADRPSSSRENLRALIAMDCHRIEKGLALRDPKPGFGAWFHDRLLSNLRRYLERYGPDPIVRVSLNALSAYAVFGDARGVDTSSLRARLDLLSRAAGIGAADGHGGGVHRLTARQVQESACRSLESFFRSRHSIRHFGRAAVPLETVEKAVSMAIFSPSVCNRGSWRVHVYSQPGDKAAVLAHQSGNRGFGDQAAHVLVVTSDLQSFASPGERNQCWVDGGMFAMSLVYALHSLGVGTCCLNFCVERRTEVALRACAGIPDSEAVIMMIAVGSLPDEFAVAQSPRRSLGEVLAFHGTDRSRGSPGSST